VKIRNCAWDFPAETVAPRCPKSVITAQSLSLLEEFLWWKQIGAASWSMDAKSADALLALEREWKLKTQNEKF
jgi:hypothetical protein